MKNYLIIFLFSIGLCGCKKFVDIESSPNQIESSRVFNDENTARSALLGLYYQAANTGLSFFTGGSSLYPALSGDELFITGTNTNAEQFFNNKLLSENTVMAAAFWNVPYKHIYHANSILEGLKNSSNLTESFKIKIAPEARCIRAICYLYLTKHFGEVPLILTTDYHKTMVLPRTSLSVVNDTIEADLLFAKENLGVEYLGVQRSRLNKFGASAILAKFYLYQGRWLEAELESTYVISAGLFSMPTDLNQAFLIGSTETIWCLIRDNGNTSEGSTFVPSSSTVKPAYALTDTLIKQFETGDKRKSNWMKSNVVGGVSYYYPNKYKVRSSTPISEGSVVLRLAEQFLIRAEARFELGKNDSALADVNRIRVRAGVTPLNIFDPSEIKKAIFKERQTELFVEWGHRWLDLKRTGNAVLHLPALKPFFQAHSQLYPIPFGELQKNVYLIQNPGY